MMIHEITEKVGKYKARKRIGRGRGSGHGKTSGRGHKGAGSRSGYSRRASSEGGQMPYFRRIPKSGFTNANFKVRYWIANLGDIIAHPDFAKGGEVNAETLVKAGLIRDTKRPLKVLGDTGESDTIKVKLTVTAARVTDKARALITDAGGSVHEDGTRRDRVRGVDRNSDDRSPKNLTKKLKRSRPKKAAPAAEEAAAPAEPS
ncbi:MAG: 50S ribosomal protein L15 [Phycisphaerales bacterium]|nr:MAG: 50S ribosomal protein L15 [Phycisphaerales bacterium]